MLNKYVWQIYMDTEGESISKMFENNLSKGLSKEYIDYISTFRSVYCPDRSIIINAEAQIDELMKDLKNDVFLLENGEYTIQSAMEYVYACLKENNCSEKNIFTCFSDSIEYFTTLLSIEIPELFIPYYFKYNFNIFEKIALEFNIRIPYIPVKKNYEERFYYYGDICSALLEFREENNMSPYELCAFLYDFAPKYIGGINSYIIKELPEPKSAFFIGGSQNDTLLNYDIDTVSCWQCNPDTRAGDMIVLYLKTPVSAVDSVWRSVSVGFNDPFFYYYRCTYISRPVRIRKISQKQLQKDEVFKDLPLVRKNMQGINGVELKPSEYNHLIDLAKADVPKLEFFISYDAANNYLNEKNVEDSLVRPLLGKIGYSEHEYVQQLYIEIGNHNYALIPDFVLLPVATRGHQCGFAVVEVKYAVQNQKQMEEAKIQVRSYAVQLKAKYAVIASKDKIWIFISDDDFVDEVFSATWHELNEPDTFSKMFKLIGKTKNNKVRSLS